MKRAVFLASFLLLAASLAMPQDTANSPSQDQSQNATAASRRSSSEVNTVRGCLSGSADNYTLTDRNGAHYRLVGQNESLAAAVGHEVEIRGSEQSSEPDSGEGETVTHYTGTFQVSQMEDTGSTCKPVSPSKSLEHPMNEPPSHLMATLEQQPPCFTGHEQPRNQHQSGCPENQFFFATAAQHPEHWKPKPNRAAGSQPDAGRFNFTDQSEFAGR